MRETRLNGRLSKPSPSHSREKTMPHLRTLKSAISTSKSQPAENASLAAARAHLRGPWMEAMAGLIGQVWQRQ